MNLPNRYQPTGQHFGGGQGVVSVWKDTALGREVAVKVLMTRGIGGSLRNEAALLGAIRSKHVVELFEIGTDPKSGKEFLIMEYVAGADLNAYVPSDLRDLLLTLFQIASGVSDIHAANCVHRDLKPDNLKRDGSNIVKIIDFGIGGVNPVNTNSGRGTDGYRAHEFFSTPIRLGPESDVYAYGVIAYEFCFGSLDVALLTTPPSFPPSFAGALIGKAKLPAEIASMLDRCLSSKPSDRPTASALKTVFAKHLLRNKHIANFVYGPLYTVSQGSPQYRITTSKGEFEVGYNGLDFVLTKVVGEVFVNGVPAISGTILPGSCVIIVGSGTGPDRAFIPFNVSHPEVVL